MRNWYKQGSANAICDICGKKFKLYELKKRWDGFWVCQSDWESRHPQDFIRGVKETLTLPITKPIQPMPTAYVVCSVTGRNGVAGLGVAGCAITGQIIPTYSTGVIVP